MLKDHGVLTAPAIRRVGVQGAVSCNELVDSDTASAEKMAVEAKTGLQLKGRVDAINAYVLLALP